MLLRRAAGCLALTCALAGCSATGSGSGSSSSTAVTATGSTLSIWVSMPPHATAAEQDVVAAEKLAFGQMRGEVTRVDLRLRVASNHELSANARQAIQDKSTIAYLGESAPGTSEDTIGITNALDVLQVSPTDTAVEETQSTDAVPGSPGRYYETLGTYGHTFARVVPSTADEAKAQVSEMKKLGVRTLCASDDGTDYGKAVTEAVRVDARADGMTVSCSSGADAEFVGAQTAAPAAAKFRAAAQANPKIRLFGPSALADGASALSGVQAGGLYVSVPSPAAGTASQVTKFDKAFQAADGHPPAAQAVFGYAAMSAVLSALGQAGGSVANRTTVVRDFHRLKNVSSPLGTYSIDVAGDTSLATFRFLKLQGGALVALKGGPVQG